MTFFPFEHAESENVVIEELGVHTPRPRSEAYHRRDHPYAG